MDERGRRVSLGLAIVAGLALLAPAAATARQAYFTRANIENPDEFTTSYMVSWYGYTSPAGDLAYQGSVEGIASQSAISFGPDGKWAYVANDTTDPALVDNIHRFQVDEATGALLGPPTAVAAGEGTPGSDGAGVRSIAVSPDGSDLYATTAGGKVAHFEVSSDDGALQLSETSAAVVNPSGIALAPDGRDAYVVDGDAGPAAAKILHYRVDSQTGALGPYEATGLPAAKAVAVSPDGGSAYVSQGGVQDNVVRYEIDEQGSLLANPTSIDTADGPSGIAVSPDGESVYVAVIAGAISQFTVTDSGLVAKDPRDVSLPGNAPQGDVVSIAPDGASMYASVLNVNSPPPNTFGIAQYDVVQGGQDAGELQPKSTPELLTDLAPTDIRVAPNQGPSANLAPLAVPASEGAPVSFDASLSTDGDGSIATYEWDFGDGTPATATTLPAVAHAYASPGEYQVAVTVTDNEGCSDRLVFTGQTAYCNGSGAARAGMTVRVDATGGETPGSPIPPAHAPAPSSPAAAPSSPAGPPQLGRVSMSVRCAAPSAKRVAGKRSTRAGKRSTSLVRCGRTRAIKPRLLVRFDSSAAAAVELEVTQTGRKGKQSKRSQPRVVLRRTLTANPGANTFTRPIKASALRGALTGKVTVAGATRASQVKVRL